jgi:hypothetical protein
VNVTNRQQLLVIVAIAGIALLAADRLLVTPLSRIWKERSVQIAELKKSMTQGELLLERDAVIREHWESMRTNTLPNDLSAAENEVLKAFDRWSQKSRISVSSIRPQWKRGAEDHMLLECRADAFGNIESVTSFLHEMEKDPLAIRVESVEIAARDNNGQQLALAVQASALMLIAEEAP